jgi:hypothetical protein
MSNRNELRKEAGLTAIEKHENIIQLLKDIILLSYGSYKVVDNKGKEIEGLQTIDMALKNIKMKEESIIANEEDIKTCYEQMELFK